MLQIQNIGQYGVSVKTWDGGGSGRPNVLHLRPNEMAFMMQQELKSWPTGAKEDLSRYVQMGTLVVKEVDGVHNGPDKSAKLDFYADDLGSAILFGVAFQQSYNKHVESAVFHTAPVPAHRSTAAVPTDLATLITLITNLRTVYTVHGAAAPPHVNADTQFICAPAAPAPVTEQDCIVALRDLNNILDGHREALVPAAAPTVLLPAQIITY